MMVYADDLRRVSDDAADLLGSIMEATYVADVVREPDADANFYGARLVDALYEIERTYKVFEGSFTLELQELFAANNDGPVTLNRHPYPSAHEAILSIGRGYCWIAEGIFQAEFPEARRPGVEYAVPREFFALDDMLRCVIVAAKATLESFPAGDDLNLAQTLRVQELARAAIKLAPKAVPVAPEPDGPCGIDQWRNNNIIVGRLKPQVWKLASRLHLSLGRKVPFGDLVGPENVFDELTDDATIQRAGSRVTKSLASLGIPLKVSSSTVDRLIWMEPNSG